MKSKGISLIETLVSVTVFGIIIVVMFQMSSAFFKLFNSASSRQDMNKTFIKAYNQMQKDFITTSGKYIYSYNQKFNDDTYKNIKNRWIVFPVATNQEGNFQGEGSSFNWKRIFIYYLNCTNESCSECNKEFLNPEDLYKYCSDKELIRITYNYNGSDDKSDFSLYLYDMILNHLNSCLINHEDIVDGKEVIFKFVEKKVLARNIFDMNISPNKTNITIILSSIRINEAKKEVSYGKTDFTQEPNTKFVDKIEFVIHARNS